MTDTISCKWCNKSFRSERTLSKHMCVKKRRWTDREMSHVRLGFRAFQIFYDLTTNNSAPKTHEQFIQSQYYADFVKFGRACLINQYLDPEGYVNFLVRGAVKLRDWPKDSVYSEFVKQYVRKETGLRALERTVINMAEWGSEHNTDWQDYFLKATTNRFVYDVRAAKISPWAIYLSNTGQEMLKQLSSEQVNMVEEFIDPKFWMDVFKKNKQEVNQVKSACEEAGL